MAVSRKSFFLFFAAVAAALKAEQTGQVLEKATAASVYIKAERNFRGHRIPTVGSGFFIDGKGTVLTNWHVVAEQVEIPTEDRVVEIATMVGTIQVVMGSGGADKRTLEAKVLATDRSLDLALPRVTWQPTAYLQLAEALPRLGDPVWVVGFSFGELLAVKRKNPEPTVTSGRISSLRRDESGKLTYLQFGAPANPANSGGPVLNGDGAAVGVVTKGVARAETTFAVPLGAVRDFLVSKQPRVELSPRAIFQRLSPVKVTVTLLLADVEGLTCTVELSGNDIPTVKQELAWKGRAFTGERTVR